MNLVLCDDLIFASRVVGAGRSLQIPVRQVGNHVDLEPLVEREVPPCVMIDLHFPGLDIVHLVQSLKRLTPAPHVVGFGSHVDTATLKAAREAGCDLVWPRSKFAAELEEALPGWCGKPQISPPG